MKNKHSNSNLANAIHHLQQIGFVVVKHATKDKYDIHRIGHKEYCDSPNYPSYWRKTDKYKDSPFDYTERELIKFAKVYSSANNQNTAIKQTLKTTSKRIRNSRIKNKLHSNYIDGLEDFSVIEPKETDKRDWD